MSNTVYPLLRWLYSGIVPSDDRAAASACFYRSARALWPVLRSNKFGTLRHENVRLSMLISLRQPVMVWLAHVSSTSNGICGTSHAYGGFNLTFSLAAFVGPIVAGQILETCGVANGFKIQIGITAAISLIMAPLTWIYMVRGRFPVGPGIHADQCRVSFSGKNQRRLKLRWT